MKFKINFKFNRFAALPVKCNKCHRYIWLERYRRMNYRAEGSFFCDLKKINICDECLKEMN